MTARFKYTFTVFVNAYKNILLSAITRLKRYGVIALLAYYVFLGAVYIWIPSGIAEIISVALGTKRGWPAAFFVLYFFLISLPLLPIVLILAILILEWLIEFVGLNRLFGLSSFAMRNAVEKWSKAIEK